MKRTGIQNVAILGSTGSIGTSALEVIEGFPERFRVVGLTAHQNIDLLAAQVKKFRPRTVAVADLRHAASLRTRIDSSTEVLVGNEGLCAIAAHSDVDLVVCALVGFAGLRPTLCAVDAGKTVALANKEVLVAGGEIVTRRVREKGGKLLPIDSEHSAILQCLQGEDRHTIRRLILTASGGPFLHVDRERLESVTVAQALNHPTWKMGNKITVDSATLMNKGLEVIEAYWLFGIPADRIDVVIHPQSIIHSMVEFVDGSVKAQMGIPDMRLPIQYALAYPERPINTHPRLNLPSLQQMTFLQPDPQRFRCLGLAYRALEMGGTATAVLNAANEVAVGMFLEGRLPFTGIPSLIEDALDGCSPKHNPTLEDVLAADRETRQQAAHLTAPLR